MSEKKRTGTPDFASVILIVMATLLSFYGVLGVVFRGFAGARSLTADPPLAVLADLSLLLWVVPLACLKFPVAGTILYWCLVVLIAVGLMIGRYDGDLWVSLVYAADKLLYVIYAGLLLPINIINTFLKSE